MRSYSEKRSVITKEDPPSQTKAGKALEKRWTSCQTKTNNNKKGKANGDPPFLTLLVHATGIVTKKKKKQKKKNLIDHIKQQRKGL